MFSNYSKALKTNIATWLRPVDTATSNKLTLSFLHADFLALLNCLTEHIYIFSYDEFLAPYWPNTLI